MTHEESLTGPAVPLAGGQQSEGVGALGGPAHPLPLVGERAQPSWGCLDSMVLCPGVNPRKEGSRCEMILG